MKLRFQGVCFWVDPEDAGLIASLLPQSACSAFAKWQDDTADFQGSEENLTYLVTMQGGCPSLVLRWVGGLSVEEVRIFQSSLPEGVVFGFAPIEATDAAIDEKVAHNVSMAEPWDKDLPSDEEEE